MSAPQLATVETLTAPLNGPGPRHTKATRAIQRRLEALELEHLRALASAQARRIERLQRLNRLRIERANYWRSASYDSDARADMFMELTRQMEDALEGQQVGLTASGQLLLVPTGEAA